MKYIIVLVVGLWMLCSTVYADLKNEPKDLFQSLEIEDLKKEVGALRAEVNQMKEEFKLIKINSGRMVEQMNALTKLVHEIRKSPKIAEQTNTPRDLLYEPKETQTQYRTVFIPFCGPVTIPVKVDLPQPKNGYISSYQSTIPLPQIMMMEMEMEKINRNLEDIQFQLQMNSRR